MDSGSTATVVLIADGQILAVNVGDSKAILCSESLNPPNDLKGNALRLSRRRRRVSSTKRYKNINIVASFEQKYIHVKELTRDHHPDRDDEKHRVESAGGYIEFSGVPRVNGQLAVSRSIGDVLLKSYGVISTPEVTDWQPLSSNDSYLVVATDGIFDKLTTQDACDLLWDESVQGETSEFIFTVAHSLADLIVKTAFERGTIDNLAAVVVPLRSPGILKSQSKGGHDIKGSKEHPYGGQEKFQYNKSGSDDNNSSLISIEYFNQITTNFNRLVVEANSKRFGCFYLSENLNENKDHDFLQQKDCQKPDVYHSLNGLSDTTLECRNDGGAKRSCKDHIFYSLFGLGIGVNNEGNDRQNFAKFLGLLDSFPSGIQFNYTNQPDYKVPEFRYILEKQFGGGSYGEVWLAFQLNCSEGSGDFRYEHKKLNCFDAELQFALNVYTRSLHTNSSYGHYFSEDDNSYILKRIKVEKGNVAYMSGLREKYFGEMFLKAFMSQGDLIRTKVSTPLPDVECTSCGTFMPKDHVPSSAYHTNLNISNANHEEGLIHLARFVEYFETPLEGFWLVFHNEGLSMKKLLYTEVEGFNDAGGDAHLNKNQIFHSSSWWHWFRKTETGRKEMRSLIHQLLLALRSCHVRGITHRDIKPDNMIICFEDTTTGRCIKRIPTAGHYSHSNLRLIDFGSSIDKFTLKHLYGSGPTRSEQTFAYTPPEALLNDSWFHTTDDVRIKYDMWSVGVFIMELILGTPNIFETNARTRAVIYQQLEGWSGDIKELAYKLKSYMDMCIVIQGISPKYYVENHDDLNCSEDSFSERVKHRDPLKLGFPNIWALRLVRQLLVWQPEDRLSVDDALQHPYFTS